MIVLLCNLPNAWARLPSWTSCFFVSQNADQEHLIFHIHTYTCVALNWTRELTRVFKKEPSSRNVLCAIIWVIWSCLGGGKPNLTHALWLSCFSGNLKKLFWTDHFSFQCNLPLCSFVVWHLLSVTQNQNTDTYNEKLWYVVQTAVDLSTTISAWHWGHELVYVDEPLLPVW